MFLIYTKSGLIVGPDYQQYFTTHEDCRVLMRAAGYQSWEYEILPVVFAQDLFHNGRT